MADINFVGAVTIAANTTVDLFATTSVTAAAGEWKFYSVPAGALVQVDTSSSATGQVQLPIVDGTFKVDAAAFYIANITSSSLTFDARFVSNT
jgi:hypothetical protein